jgi:hypothetical protein
VQVTVSIQPQVGKFSAGTTAGNWRIELELVSNPGTLADSYEGSAPSQTFDLSEGERYNVSGMRLDQSGALLGPVETVQFTVGEDLVTIDVASSISAVSKP